MRRALAIIGFAALCATTLFAQQHDTDKMQSAGSLPAGWSVRLDSGSTKPDGVSVMPMGGGVHFKSGPAGIYYRSTDTKSGSYEVHASFNQVEPSEHPEAYGLFVGGSNLAGAPQKYTYFLVRQDGTYLVKQRDGEKTTDITKGWVASPAVHKTDAKGTASNLLEIDNKSDTSKVVFKANGTAVYTLDAKATDVNGVVGLRVNHNLDLHIDGFDVHR